MPTMPLKEVDKVEILTILDNTIDMLLPDGDKVKRLPRSADAMTRESLIAEHGFAALVTVSSGNTSESLLFDAGLSKKGLIHNMDVLEVKPKELHTIVLSHGHADHTRGLMGMVERLGERKMPLLLHPDAFLERKVIFPDGHEINLPPPDRRVLSQDGIEFIEERGPSYLLGGLVLVTGQVHRTTDFETGFPIHYALRNDEWQKDPYIHDDQAVVVHVKEKGLVVLTGCGHAGAINTIRQAQELTGVQKVHAVIGGFHLSGLLFEPIIPPTVAALKELNPEMIVPAHCTGWKAVHAIARDLPQAFVQNSVGTRFVLSC
ncbi:MAG TPA: MBL fold metallo-hydrolase [Candidatus Binatia bacterium]|jgi:7,8-dihydropterin-6-yl-methyl-4-(beta-D-ribofuranosyl)aminobenzene 5'-phosphate synthase|nr:MBL fold metallo-hydrolase [Candidatus Binatia bacterium]